MGLGLGLGASQSSYIGFLPTDISSLALWLQNGVGITAAKWDDSSGNDNHATQATEANQAAVVSGGLDFTPENSDHYDLANTITIAHRQGFCVAIVMDTESSSNNFIFSKDANDQLQFGNAQTFIVKTNDPSAITTNLAVETGTFGNQKQLILLNRSVGDPATFTIFKNGDEATIDGDSSTNTTNANGFDINVLGSQAGTANFFDGIMFEVLFFTQSLSSAEISELNIYLKSKHGL
tara:strand:+ start:31 stop:738 length:708 start_codon:yes stop_codon:yes gene_type:complete